jgi:hypothetical protein
VKDFSMKQTDLFAFLLASTLLVSACSGSGGSTSSPPPTDTSTSSSASTGVSTSSSSSSTSTSSGAASSSGGVGGVLKLIGDAIKSAEKSGALPTLNRDDTILGPDVDANGVRDDIDAIINALPDTELQKKALRQNARALARTLVVDFNDPNAVRIAMNGLQKASRCKFYQYPPTEYQLLNQRNNEIEKWVVNTKTRFMAYQKFSAALNGTSNVGIYGGNYCEN